MTIEMKMDQRYEQGRKKGRNEGEQNRDKELITKWLQKGKSIAEIAENLDRTEEYVKKFMCVPLLEIQWIPGINVSFIIGENICICISI